MTADTDQLSSALSRLRAEEAQEQRLIYQVSFVLFLGLTALRRLVQPARRGSIVAEARRLASGTVPFGLTF